VEHKTIKEFGDFKAGDCIVAFSRKTVFQIKNAINKSLNKKASIDDDSNHCAVIYVSTLSFVSLFLGGTPTRD